MDPLDILKRSWKTLWSYRALWVFALILGLTAGGSSFNFSNPGNNFQNRMEDNADFREFTRQMEGLFGGDLSGLRIPGEVRTTLMWVILAIVLLLLVLAIVFTVLRYISETAVIRMVDENERSAAQPGVRAGFRLGWSRAAWRLFLINLLVSLPAFLLILFMLIAGLSFFWLALQGNIQETSWPGWVALGLLMVPVVLVVIVISVLLNLWRQFAWRVSALEGSGVIESFRRGYAVMRRNWQSVGIMWLILVGVGIVWGVATFIAFFLLIPVYILTAIVGLIVAGIPALLVGGISSLFMGEWAPWVLAAVVGLPLFFMVTFSPLIFLGGLGKVFTSSAWTLTFRELTALGSLAPSPESLPPSPEGGSSAPELPEAEG